MPSLPERLRRTRGAAPAPGRLLPLLALLVFAVPSQAWTPYGQRPNALDLMETGLYWLQEYTGYYDPRDPASAVSLMEDQIGQFFDLTVMAHRVGGPWYRSLNLLERSHFQNRLRDQLFEILAREFGWLDVRPPRVWMRGFVRSGHNAYVTWFLVRRPGPQSLRQVKFHIHYTPVGWRIHEVVIAGVPVTAMLRP